MRVPFLLFVVCFLAALSGLWLTGAWDAPPVLLALVSAFAAMILMLLAKPEAAPKAPPRSIVVDGSNIMHWKGETPQLATLREVVKTLAAQGYQPGVVFDANAGYKLMGRYMDDRPLARALGLPADRVLVVPKGEAADPVILTVARELGASVLSNDRFRDWAGDFPEVAQPGYVRRGGYRGGVLWMDTAR